MKKVTIWQSRNFGWLIFKVCQQSIALFNQGYLTGKSNIIYFMDILFDEYFILSIFYGKRNNAECSLNWGIKGYQPVVHKRRGVIVSIHQPQSWLRKTKLSSEITLGLPCRILATTSLGGPDTLSSSGIKTKMVNYPWKNLGK